MDARTGAAAQTIARNIMPLAGIVLLGWNAQNVLILYFADTLLAMAVLFAGVILAFNPIIRDDGVAARLNSEVGVIGGAAFLALVMAVPLGVPLFFMLGGRFDWQDLTDPALLAGLGWQCAAACWSYASLYRALHHATPESLQLKRRFAMVLLRWMALVMVAFFGVGFLLGPFSALVFVAIYIAVSLWAELAPDHFLRAMPGGTEDARAPTAASRMPTRARRPKKGHQ
ncbi:MAG TPA: hypothetical protein VNE58_18320 [Casimicrobiaceae bacterium]|nr:hypothetical protein [Casimicrobiaceae bacterium]